jgi:kynurenine formamidase
MSDGYPKFAELPIREGAPPGSSWGVFGEDDERGTLNFITEESVSAAARCVQDGTTFGLNWDLRLPDPALYYRENLHHRLFTVMDGIIVDDAVDNFFLQGSSQWDGLRHMADVDFGFYNGATAEVVTTPGPGRLGMEHWAKTGIVARGVLLDVVRAMDAEGVAMDPLDHFEITADVLERVLERQGVTLAAGDILVLRTGWIEGYTALDHEAREQLAKAGSPGSPGLAGDDLAGFLWDRRIAAVAADNPELEAARPVTGSGLVQHKALIPRLGMPLGELWDVARLADACAADGRYAFLLCTAPAHLPGAAGSPANAVAIR